jgi:peptide/nickel transport system ATP-binding protein
VSDALLTVEDLRVSYDGVPALRGVSFAMGREKVALVGESGSGKSTLGRAILKLLPHGARMRARRLSFGGTDILAAGEAAMRRLRGRHIAMVMQDPRYALNPLIPVGRQIEEAYRLHIRASRGAARERALALLEAVRIRDPARVLGLYPHQLSGGMGQRVMLAMMVIQEPDLLIADEPTSALDVSVRQQVLAVLDDLVRASGLGLIFITHDLTLAETFCDRVLVMYRGVLVEQLPASALRQARHPYTQGLLACAPGLGPPHRRLPVLDRARVDAPPLDTAGP